MRAKSFFFVSKASLRIYTLAVFMVYMDKGRLKKYDIIVTFSLSCVYSAKFMHLAPPLKKIDLKRSYDCQKTHLLKKYEQFIPD